MHEARPDPALVLLALVTFASPSFAQSFEDYFHPVDTVALSTEALLGNIESIDVDDEGRILVKDLQQAAVHLFAADGSLVRRLSVAECNPGFEMHPIKAVFNGDEIFMSNSGVWGYRFNRDGTCKGPVDAEYRPSMATSAAPNEDRAGSIFDLHAIPIGYWIKEFDHTGRLIRDFEKDDYLARYVNRFGIQYIMADSKYVYLVLPNRPTARRYTRDGAFVDEIGFVPDNFREIRKDLEFPEGDVAAMMRAIPRQTAPYSTVTAAGILDAHTFVVQYQARAFGQGMGYHVIAYDSDGVEVMPPVFTERWVAHVGGGRIYVLDTNELSADDISNPSLLIYE